MSTPQQPELRRSGKGASDPASTKTHVQADTDAANDSGPTGFVPEDNRPGHHPEVEQDKPTSTKGD